MSLLQSEESTGGKGKKEKILLDYLNSIGDPSLLTCLGLVRLDGKVCVALNGRPIKITDCDNIGCKISVAQGKTTGSRLSIEEPAVNNPYDFPLYPAWRELEGGRMKIKVFAETALAAYTVRRKKMFAQINPNFMFHQEKFRWPRMCAEMTSGNWKDRRETEIIQGKGTRKVMTGRRHRAGPRAVPKQGRKRGGNKVGEDKPRKERKVKEGGKGRGRNGVQKPPAEPTRRSDRIRCLAYNSMAELTSDEEDRMEEE
jgi:hypothetical protein